MAIETGPASATQGAAVHGAGHAHKNRGKGADAGAFALLLSGMGGQAGADALAAAAEQERVPADEAVAGDPGQGLPGVPTDAACLAAMAAAPAADAADVAARAKGVPGLADAQAHAGAHPPLDAGLPAAGSGTAASEAHAPMDREPQAESIAELVAGLKASASSSSPDAKANAALSAQQEAATHTSTVELAMRSDDNRPGVKAASSHAAAFDPARSAAAGMARSAAAHEAARDVKSTSQTAPVDSLVSATAQLLAAFDAKEGATPDRGRDKPGSGSQSHAAGSPFAAGVDHGPASVSGTHGEMSFAASVAAGQQLTPEELVAQQVSVWITQKTQAAELKLDGFGDQPVEVSISLTGNEAEVAFRSDNAPARAWLESAMPQLKELLQSEGLLLAGLSVGTSGKGGADADAGGRPGRDAQSGAGGKPEPAMPQAAPARAAKPLGVVDVFA